MSDRRCQRSDDHSRCHSSWVYFGLDPRTKCVLCLHRQFTTDYPILPCLCLHVRIGLAMILVRASSDGVVVDVVGMTADKGAPVDHRIAH